MAPYLDAPARSRGSHAGRPSKGDRHKFIVRMPRHFADYVMQDAVVRDISYGDYVALLAMAALESGLQVDGLPERRAELVVQEELSA